MTDSSTLLDAVRSAVAERRAPAAEVRVSLAQLTDPALPRKAGRLLGELRRRRRACAPVTVAVLATCTVGPFEPLLRASWSARARCRRSTSASTARSR